MLLASALPRFIRIGRLRLIDAAGKTHVFEGSPGPSASVRLHDPSLHWKFLLSPRFYVPDAYMNGGLTIEEGGLYEFLDILTLNEEGSPGGRLMRLGDIAGRVLRYIHQYNPVQRARRNVEHHYDLSDRVHFHLRDYREERGEYDRIVSVGMFEHVGVNQYGVFFDKLNALLKPDGVALLHSIGRMDGPGTTNPWIRKYIFPGGYCPALSEVVPNAERRRLWITDIEVLRLHYAETLRAWRARFEHNREQIRTLYDERFCRMWETYLVGAELSFRNEGMLVFQMQLAKVVDTVPLTRDYITDWERAHGDASENRAA